MIGDVFVGVVFAFFRLFLAEVGEEVLVVRGALLFDPVEEELLQKSSAFQSAVVRKTRKIEPNDAQRSLHHVGERLADLWHDALGIVDPTEHLEGDF